MFTESSYSFIDLSHLPFKFTNLLRHSIEINLFFRFKGIDIARDIEVVIVVADLFQRRNMAVLLLSFPVVVSICNLVDMFRQQAILSFHLLKVVTCINKQNTVVVLAALTQHQHTGWDTGAIEDIRRQADDCVNTVQLPMFALFQSDRSSRDSDDEVQSPMKAAITAALAEVQDDIARIQLRVQQKAEEIARNTHEALKTIEPGLARELTPEFTPPTPAKWQGLFSVGLNTDGGIPLNKRGSGVRRLVLVSFFKAEAERRLKSSNRRSIIYAIEEPETSQHPNYQRILIESFKSLSLEAGCQVILTTHSPGFASELPIDSIRFVSRDTETGQPVIQAGADVFGIVTDTLGVTPDNRVRLLFCVEGPTDVAAFKALSKALHAEDNTLPDLESDERVAFIVLGGGTLKHWVNENYLRALNRREIHIYDRDVPAYAEAVDAVNARGNGCWAAQTLKHEVESYLHPDAIHDAFGVVIAVTDHPVGGKATPKVFAEAYSLAQRFDGVMKDNAAKARLAERAFPLMTAARIHERDPEGEVLGWMRRIRDMIQ